MAAQAFARHKALKDKIRSGTPVVGTFVKTPAVQTVEILGGLDFDFLVLDAEHAPFDLAALDRCILAGRSVEMPILVRVPDTSSEMILKVLDLGAAGIVSPHVLGPEIAAWTVAMTRYRHGAYENDGVRGFSPSGRSGAYGKMEMSDYRAQSDDSTIVIGQIEDWQAFDILAEIAAIDSMDAMLIGRADLAISFGVDNISHNTVSEKTNEICAEGNDANKTVGIFLPNAEAVPEFLEKGVSLFIIGTDQSHLAVTANNVTGAFRKAVP